MTALPRLLPRAGQWRMFREWIAEVHRSPGNDSNPWMSSPCCLSGPVPITAYSPTICATARATTPCSWDAFATLTGMSFANASS